MKIALLALTTISLTLSAHAAAPNAEKVAAALNASVGEAAVQVENGRLKIARSQHNNKEAGFEDCRQLAINSALLDVAMAGDVPELVAKGSHRILLSMAGDENSVRGIVGIKATQDNGGIAERAYSYLLQDGGDKHCSLVANEGYVAGMTKRSKVEKDYLKNVIPKLTAEDKAKMYKKEEVTTDADLSTAAVKKLLKGECAETALNQALAGSAKAFAEKSKEKSVAYLVLGLGESSLVTEGTNAKGSIKVVRTDGANTIKTLTTLAMLEGDKSCTLTSVSTAEVK
ncbi:MAG: hypothetical protein ACXWQO_17290 [Bdellovibrionota bacterium]